MAVTTEIPWGDGSGDKIYLTRDASEGDQVVSVSSDANTGNARSKVVTFTSGVGNIQRQLTINQAAGREPLPAEDGRIWVYYNVNTTTSNTNILYSGTTSNLTGTMLVDGVSKSRATTYKFPTTGMHLVQFNLNSSNTNILANQFRNLSRARRMFVPSKITTLGQNCFYQTSWDYIVFRRTTPASYSGNALYGTYPIYVPWSADHSVLNAYKSSWSSYRSRIYELNEDGTIPE
jgi:hypothetical protein